MTKFTKTTMPEPNKWIRLYCHDWSEYRIIGMRVPYKESKQNKGGGWRIMTKNEHGLMEKAGNAWADCESWEYCNEGDAP